MANVITPVQLATFSFTPTATGTAVVTGRGYCNVTGGATAIQLNIGIGTVLANIFTAPNFSDVVALSLPAGEVAQNWQIPFIAETTIPVTANVASTLFLAARREVASANAANCIGSFSVDISGTRP